MSASRDVAIGQRGFFERSLDLRRWTTLSGRERLLALAPLGLMVVLLLIALALGLGEPLVAIVLGVGAAAAFFIGANKLVDPLPTRTAERIRPWIFVGPALVFLAGALLIPAIWSLWLSLLGPTGEGSVGFENWEWAFTSEDIRTVFRNNVLWIVLVTGVSTVLGLTMAVLADRLKYESLAKSAIFLPMAISFVGAAVIWRFVYAFKPEGQDQTGLLNALWTGAGGSPIAWLLEQPWNNLFLIWVMIWMQTGFAMVILSAAIKGVPGELIEASRIDGANEWQVFRFVTLPTIKGTLIVVITTTLILVLKVFDIVRVMTAGNFETQVLANAMIDELSFGNDGRAGALAVILFILVIPVLIYNVRQFRSQGVR